MRWSASTAAIPQRAARGLVEPNPLQPVVPTALAAMASAPTVTKGSANAASTIANADAIVAPTDARFRYLGATPTVVNTNYVRAESWASGAPAQAVWGVEWGADCDMLDLVLSGPSTNVYWLWIDGQPIGLHGAAGPGPTGQRFRYLVDFTSAGGQAFRRFALYLDANVYFGGVNVATDDAVFEPDWFLGPKVVWVGDSFVAGSAQETDVFAGFAGVASRALGWRNVRWAGQGGTGYLNPGTSGKLKYRDRIAYDVATDADVVVVVGGYNDGTYGVAAVQAEATLYLQAIRARAAQAVVVVVLPFEIAASASAGTADARTGVLAASAAVGIDLVIDPQTGFRFTSTLAGRYKGADVHPTDAGNEYIGRMIAAKMRAWMVATGGDELAGSRQGAIFANGPARLTLGS